MYCFSRVAQPHFQAHSGRLSICFYVRGNSTLESDIDILLTLDLGQAEIVKRCNDVAAALPYYQSVIWKVIHYRHNLKPFILHVRKRLLRFVLHLRITEKPIPELLRRISRLGTEHPVEMALGAERKDRGYFRIGIIREAQHILHRLHPLGQNILRDGCPCFLFEEC